MSGIFSYSRTALLRPPSKSDRSGRKRWVVIHKGLYNWITCALRCTPIHNVHTNSFINVFRSALQNTGKHSDLSATASSDTSTLFLDQSTQYFDIWPYKTMFRKHRSNIGSHIYVACLIATFVYYFHSILRGPIQCVLPTPKLINFPSPFYLSFTRLSEVNMLRFRSAMLVW